MTSEEKFKARLLLWHRSYCRTSRFLSVTVDDDAGHVDVFANKYCAQCHGASAADTTDWKCYFDDHMISECNVTGEWPARDEFVQRACGAYLDPKWIHDTVFKNPFCFLCNADPTLRATQKLLYGFCPNHVGLSPMPFSALVDFYDAIYSVEEQSASSQCRDSEIYDAEKDQCRLVLCSQGRQYRKGNCSVVLHSALGLAYSLSFGMTSQTELRLDVNDTLHKLPESLADAVMQLLDFKTRNKKFVVTFDTTDP
nr:hypothetical protein BaRGS_020180 [Batillaria attramentaria]